MVCDKNFTARIFCIIYSYFFLFPLRLLLASLRSFRSPCPFLSFLLFVLFALRIRSLSLSLTYTDTLTLFVRPCHVVVFCALFSGSLARSSRRLGFLWVVIFLVCIKMEIERNDMQIRFIFVSFPFDICFLPTFVFLLCEMRR